MSEDSDIGAGGQPVPSLIQRAKSQLEQMIDLNPESMVMVEGGGRVLRANRAFLDLIGIPAFSQVLGAELGNLMDPGDAQFFETLLADRSGRGFRETTVRMAGGEERLLRFTVIPGDKDTQTLVVIAHDATREKSESELLARAYKVEAIRALMGALMHHLNQPLTVLMVRARLMQQDVERGRLDPEDLKKSFNDIMDLTMQMANVLKRVEESDDYQTQEYIRGLDILKIDGA